MTCDRIREVLLTDYLDGEIEAGRKAEVDAHLSGCAACRQVLAAARDVQVPLTAEGVPQPGEHVWQHVRDRIEAPRVSVVDAVRGWWEEVLWGGRPAFVYSSALAAMLVVLVIPATLYRHDAVVRAEKEAIVQLAYLDGEIPGVAAGDDVGTGTMVEYWL